MPPNRDDDSTSPAALRKGAACLQCRKRKMRCDAGQPQCANCVKGKKDCQYAAGRAKTKTQLLREKIQDLETKIRALEQNNPTLHSSDSSGFSSSGDHDEGEFPSPSSEMNTMIGAPGSGSSSQRARSAAVSSAGEPDALTSSPHMSPGLGSLWGPDGQLDATPEKWWERPEPPRSVRDFLISIFLQHCEDFYYYINKPRFLASLDLPSQQQPHPSLLNAIYLLGCHFTHVQQWTTHEPMFLARARECLLASLAHSDRLFDFLMASNLVAYYLYRTGRFLEGHHQTAGASRFAVSCGLHQIISPVWEDNQGEGSSRTTLRASAPWSVSDMSVRRPGSMLPPPKDGAELGQRIIVFWQTYLLDKLGSAVTSLPGSLPDEADPLTEILTAWPRTIEEYERGDVRGDETATVRNLYAPYYSQVIRRRPETLQGLQVQVTALHERASRLSPTYNADTSIQGRQQFWLKFSIVRDAISKFMLQLPPLQNTGSMGEIPPTSLMAPINLLVFNSHTLAHLSIIQLHHSLANEIPDSYDRCLASARDILQLALTLRAEDYARMAMEVILSYAWTITAQILIRHQRSLASTTRFEELTQIDAEVESIVRCLESLRATYPVVDFQLRKVADWRSG